jgi:hypothetical protein
LFLDTGETDFDIEIPIERSQVIALIEVLARLLNGADQ